jgi:hypothetical protein
LQQKINEVGTEQDRIRRNMEYLDRTSDLYKRYVKKFDDQETAVEHLRAEIEKLQTQENAARKSLDSYLTSLDLP